MVWVECVSAAGPRSSTACQGALVNRATALLTTTPSAFQEEFAAERLRQLKSRFHLLLYVSMVTSAAFAVSDAAVLPPNVGSLQPENLS